MDQILGIFSMAGGYYVYLIIILLLVAGAFAFPFPEDLIFLASGYLAHKGVLEPFIAVLVGLFGLLISDSIIYFLGNKIGLRIFSIPFLRRVITKKSLEKAEYFLNKHGTKSIFISKFILGLRYPVFFASGIFTTGYKRFILCDLSASLLTVPTLVYLGYFNGHRIDMLLEEVKKVQYEVLGVFIAMVVIFAIVRYLKKLKSGKIR